MNNMCALRLRPFPGTILAAQPLIFSLLTLDLPSEVQTWHSWSKRHRGTRASSPTSQRDQNRRGYKIRHHTRPPPQTHHLSKNIHTCRCHKAHMHTHTCQSHVYCEGINPLNLICSKHSLPFSFLPSGHISLNSSQVRGYRALIPRGNPRSHLGHREGPSQASLC